MATALELTREGWVPYIAALSRRPVLPQVSPEEQWERKQLLARIRQAAAMLKSRFAARRVVLFGSLAHASWFVRDSDVDLAIEGPASEDYWQAWRLAEEMLGDHPVDLIEIETGGESLKRAIERYGVEL
ncbi:MAG: nucleotidyltransferase domain-containing protein [Desulfobacterales bacterium]|nr:nucleotidyltransferase domain-containing protein [Desulfobacterales bacterium]